MTASDIITSNHPLDITTQDVLGLTRQDVLDLRFWSQCMAFAAYRDTPLSRVSPEVLYELRRMAMALVRTINEHNHYQVFGDTPMR